MNDEEDKNKKGEGKGFAGLSSMASDVDDAIVGSRKEPEQTVSTPSPSSPPDKKQSSNPRSTASKPSPRQSPVQPSGGGSTGKWLLIAVVIGLFWVAGLSENKAPSKPYSPSSSSTSKPIARQPKVTQPRVPARFTESKPAPGQNRVLPTSELRYCVAEEIRLDAANISVDTYSQSDVDRFNNIVNDYNIRCGEFRYREGALGRARRDVEPYRSQLEAEGRGRFKSPVEKAPVVRKTKPSLPKPDPLLLAIQQHLNQLGYNAGTADGLYGNRTKGAIIEFQQSNGFESDGVVSSSLLSRLILANQNRNNPFGVLSSERNSDAHKSQSVPGTPPPIERSRDRANFETCITGKYPTLCKHSLLTRSEAVRVDAAERQANFETCITGKYPTLCKHSLLTPGEAALVATAERNAM